MIKIVICDDEKDQRNFLEKVIVREMELQGLEYSLFQFVSGESLVAAIKKEDFDIIFLDIEMKSLDGIATAKAIRQCNKTTVIIFVTAYVDFVFQGYEVRALNYILKPCKTQSIVDVLNDALGELADTQDKFYTVETKGEIYKLNLKDVIYFSSDKRKIIAVTETKKVEFYGKLDDLPDELPSFFVRCHQRYLVNMKYVTAAENNFATVKGEKIPISRSRYQDFIISFAKSMLE
ncbi:MAG: LytTR family DNA-binding domain-containing protein [Clostridiales bacterium]